MRHLAKILCLVAFVSAAGCDADAPAPAKKPPPVVEPLPDRKPEPPPVPALHTWQDCQGSDQAWVRQTLLLLAGRRPFGQGEVLAWTDAVAAVRRAEGQTASKDGYFHGDQPYKPAWNSARKTVALAMMRDGRYAKRWADFVMDALRVVRVETKSQQECYGPPLPDAYDDGTLARFVRDNGPRTAFPGGTWKLRDLVSSAIALDDVSVLWRAHLFAMVNKPFTAANVGFLELERARRQDFGRIFDAAYLHRDFVCMGCHNSEFSVTAHPDPQLNRAWPLPGRLERALFGSPTGKHSDGEMAAFGPDTLRAHAPLRVSGVADGPNRQRPWGWNDKCGELRDPTEPDPLGHDALLGSVRGDTASVWDLEKALHRGLERLAVQGLQLDNQGDADPDDALAWLVSQSIVQQIWLDVMGQPLTVANYFPRTEQQRDALHTLTQLFVSSRYSLRTLLTEIAVHPAYNLRPPEAGCGQAYELPRLLNPWSNHESDPNARLNSPGDAVHALPPRLLLRSLHTAMDWEPPAEFPAGDNRTLQAALGVFLKDAEPGHRGLDFSGRLAWESAYGRCAPRTTSTDLVDLVAQKALTDPQATWADAVALLQDRLIGEPEVVPGQVPLLQELLGVDLSAAPTATDGQDRPIVSKLRLLCGALLATPQFLLSGLPAPDSEVVPRLTPTSLQWAGRCATVSERFVAAKLPYTLTCGESRQVTASPAEPAVPAAPAP
jgi:hypothetical protein